MTEGEQSLVQGQNRIISRPCQCLLEHLEDLLAHPIAVREAGDSIEVEGGDDLNGVVEEEGDQYSLGVGAKGLDCQRFGAGEGPGKHGCVVQVCKEGQWMRFGGRDCGSIARRRAPH